MAFSRFLGVKGQTFPVGPNGREIRPPIPTLWYLSAVAEEFGCTLSQARREVEEFNPYGDVEEVMLMRHFARTKRDLDTAEPKNKPTGAMADLVSEIEAAVVQELWDQAPC